jgi:hypothetical protein
VKTLLKKLRFLITQRPQAATSILLFGVCLFVYLSNDITSLASNDNIPTTIQALNWLQNHSLNLDNFRGSYFYRISDDTPYFFTEAPNGHLTSTYPIGSVLITFPLYFVFFISLKITAFFQTLTTGNPVDLLNLTNQSFELYRKGFGKLAASICSAFSVVIFYLIVRLKFQQATALIATFLFAFATSTWALCSQDIRQHTVSNLLVISIVFCLFKADRLREKRRTLMLLLAGVFCGILPGVRLTSSIFSAAAFVFVIYAYRKEARFFLLGLPTVLINFAWNIYFFGLKGLTGGGYSQQFDSGASGYRLSPSYFTEAFFGQLISPSDGIFAFSPVLLFAFPGAYLVFKRRAGKDEQLILCLTFACVGLFFHYCFYAPWTGGSDSFGARFLTDIVPVLCLLVAYCLDEIVQWVTTRKQFIDRLIFSSFLALLLLSTFVQMVGASTKTDWGNVPIPLINQPDRLWQIRDSQIERHTRNFLARIHHPIDDPETYAQNLAGTIDRIEWIKRDGTIEPIDGTLKIAQNYRRILRLQVKNTGQSEWYGYENGMIELGETRMRVLFYNKSGKRVKLPNSNAIFVSGNIQPGQTVEAIGKINFPRKAGTYEARFVLIASGMEKLRDTSQKPLYRLNVEILNDAARPK